MTDHLPISSPVREELQAAKNQFRDSVEADDPPRVRLLTTFVVQHLYDPSLNVAYVEDECPAHSRIAAQKFQMIHGCTIRRFIETCRLRAATRVMELDEDVNLSTVAACVGYNRYRTFLRAFKRVFDCPPTEYDGTAP